MAATTRTTGYLVCKIDGKGRIEIVRRFARHCDATRRAEQADTRFFLVTEFVAIDPTADDHGTVYYMDANGEMLAEPPHNA